MDYQAIKKEIKEADQKGDTARLYELATGLLAGREESDKKLRRLVEIGRPATGMEDEWDHTIQAVMG